MQGTPRGGRVAATMQALIKRARSDAPRDLAMQRWGRGHQRRRRGPRLELPRRRPAATSASARRLPPPASDSSRRSARKREHGLDARHLRQRRRARLRRARTTATSALGATAARMVVHLRRTSVGRRRFRLDRLRLSRRADAVRLAVHQLALRHHRHVRLPEGPLLLLPGVVERQTRAAPLAALELERQRGTGRRGVGASRTPIASSSSSTARAPASKR